MKKLIVCILPLLLLSACAVMDVTIQETALPLPDGKVEVVAYKGLGLELNNLIPSGSDNESDINAGWYITGIKFGIPLSEKTDLNSRIYTSGYMTGVKVGPKIVFSEKRGHYLAAIPSVSTLVSHHDLTGYDQYASLGGDLVLVSSWARRSKVVPTVSAHIGCDRVFSGVSMPGSTQNKPHNLLRGGVNTNLKLSHKSVFLCPELGMEFLSIKDTGLRMFPTFSLGLGFQL